MPAYFNDAQRQATKDAGRIAGLNVIRLVTGYEGTRRGWMRGYYCRGTRVLIPGYKGISIGLRGYKCRNTRVLVSGVLVPGYEGISAGVRGYGTRVLVSGYESISVGVRGY